VGKAQRAHQRSQPTNALKNQADGMVGTLRFALPTAPRSG